MAIQLATKDDLEWINAQYKDIDFIPSTLENEIIAIVTHHGDYAGVGRIVSLCGNEAEIGGIYILNEFRGLSLASELVGYLVETAIEKNFKTIYCLPFVELKNFYEKFGFIEFNYDSNQINEKVFNKFKWCLANYEKQVLLLQLTHN